MERATQHGVKLYIAARRDASSGLNKDGTGRGGESSDGMRAELGGLRPYSHEVCVHTYVCAYVYV